MELSFSISANAHHWFGSLKDYQVLVAALFALGGGGLAFWSAQRIVNKQLRAASGTQELQFARDTAKVATDRHKQQIALLVYLKIQLQLILGVLDKRIIYMKSFQTLAIEAGKHSYDLKKAEEAWNPISRLRHFNDDTGFSIPKWDELKELEPDDQAIFHGVGGFVAALDSNLVALQDSASKREASFYAAIDGAIHVGTSARGSSRRYNKTLTQELNNWLNRVAAEALRYQCFTGELNSSWRHRTRLATSGELQSSDAVDISSRSIGFIAFWLYSKTSESGKALCATLREIPPPETENKANC
jgi:hypothetical protein